MTRLGQPLRLSPSSRASRIRYFAGSSIQAPLLASTCASRRPAWHQTYNEKGRNRCPRLGRGSRFLRQALRDMTLSTIKSMPVSQLCGEAGAPYSLGVLANSRHAMEVIDAWGSRTRRQLFVWCKSGRMGLDTGPGKIPNSACSRRRGSRRGCPRRSSGDYGAQARATVKSLTRCASALKQLVAGPYVELFARSSRPGWDTWESGWRVGCTRHLNGSFGASAWAWAGRYRRTS